MNQFCIKPTILEFNTCREWLTEFAFQPSDLIITSKHLWQDYFTEFDRGATVIFLRDYGNGEPTDLMVDRISADLEGKNFTRVIAIGGGAVLDVGKLFCLKQVSPVCDLFEQKIPLVRDKELILVPTTCGTGSEVTNISILELTTLGTKKGLAQDAILADKAVLIPELLENLPFSVFVTSSVDALIHAIESFLSPKATAFSKLYAKQAMRQILQGYITVAQHGKTARHTLFPSFLQASTFAGISFQNAGCGAVHALSYPLGATFHIPHGEANYAILFGVLRYYKEHDKTNGLCELEQLLAKSLGCPKQEVYEKLDCILSSMLAKKSLQEYGVTEQQLTEFAESVAQNQTRLLQNGYQRLDTPQILHIYQTLY